MVKNTTTVILISAILLLVNILARQYFVRFDLTKDKQYTLSNATKNILQSLEEPVTVSAYFSKDVPTDIIKTRNAFVDMLLEYSSISKGMLDYEIIDPSDDTELQQQAAQNGIQPVLINVREKDQASQQRAYLGAVLKMGDRQEVIPLVQPGLAMEYELSTKIKKMAVVDKPSIGLIQGHGEPGLSQLQAAYQSMSILYAVENIDLQNEAEIPIRFKTVILLAPKDSIPETHLAKLDGYLAQGGNLFIGINRVEGNFQNAQGTAVTTGLETWLANKGLQIDGSFIIDATCGTVQVQQQVGPFSMPVQTQFPYFPLINDFPDHPINKGLEQVAFQFASPINYVGDSVASFTPFLYSSENSGTLAPPVFFDVQKKWAESDFPMSRLVIGGVLEGNLVGNTFSRIVLVSDGDFAQAGGDNVNLLVNGVDWLSDDTGLIDLRTKGITTRPIDELEDSTRSLLKWGNFLIPILLVLVYGFFRFQRQRNVRMKRMQERYG